MALGKSLAVAVLALSSLGCQTIVVGSPSWPPCYLEDANRYAEADRLQRQLPATYEWVREMDALCQAWTE
jgi:hypothetical protein